MRHANDTFLYGRFILSYLILMVGLSVAITAAKLMPLGHPSRSYIQGRVRVTRRNARVALRAPRRH